MSECILDASAIIALIEREDGWQKVAEVSRRLISAVNVAEAGSVFTRKGYTLDHIRGSLASARVEVVDFDEQQALEAARLMPLTRARGLSLGDRACLALARVRQLPAVTADRAWTGLDVSIPITLIR